MPAEPLLDLPAPLTLRLYAGTEVVFSSEKHWLHPLFDLEDFFARNRQDPALTCLVDRVTGRAAAFLVARLGIRRLQTRVLSRRARPVLDQYGIQCRCLEEVDRVACATEDLLADTLDLETAWPLIQARRDRAKRPSGA